MLGCMHPDHHPRHKQRNSKSCCRLHTSPLILSASNASLPIAPPHPFLQHQCVCTVLEEWLQLAVMAQHSNIELRSTTGKPCFIGPILLTYSRLLLVCCIGVLLLQYVGPAVL
jgi:hypothetical protein